MSETASVTRTAARVYDIAIFLKLDEADAVGELLDDDRFREVLDVLHTHGRGVAIPPALNLGRHSFRDRALRRSRHERSPVSRVRPARWRRHTCRAMNASTSTPRAIRT